MQVLGFRTESLLRTVIPAGTDALLSSFDSVNIMRPPAVATPGRDLRSEPPPSWWHTDQAPRKAGLECIQGLLNLSDVGPHAGKGVGHKGIALLPFHSCQAGAGTCSASDTAVGCMKSTTAVGCM